MLFLKQIRTRTAMVCLCAAVLLLSFSQVVNATLRPESRLINEHQLVEGLSQNHTSYAYFKFVVGMRWYTGKENLVVKAIADSFESDPDVFISKVNEFPQDSSSSEWSCERKGSETCILHNGEFQTGDTIYLGIKCQKACTYKLYTHYASIRTVYNGERTQFRFDAYSTQLIRYYIPSLVKRKLKGAVTVSAMIKVQPEDKYTQMDVYMSQDPNFYLLQEKPGVQIIDNGIAVKFMKGDLNWCVKCFVYILVNIYKEQRYYVTAESLWDNEELDKYQDFDIVVNPFQQECYSFVLFEKRKDLVFTILEYSGHADTYVLGDNDSTGPKDKMIYFRSAHGTSKQIILDSHTRDWYGQINGNHFICFYATTPYSARLKVAYFDWEETFDSYDGQIITTAVPNGEAFKVRFNDDKLMQEGFLNVFVHGQDWKDTDPDAEVYFGVCNFNLFTDCIQKNDQPGLQKVSMSKISEGQFNATIKHSPHNCYDPSVCILFFKLVNPTNEYKALSFRVDLQVFNPQDVNLKLDYVNEVQYGEFVNYEINPKSNIDIQQYLSSLTIKIEAMIGDSDLFVSFDSANPRYDDHDYASREISPINQITLVEQDEDWLNRPIFFSVYGNEKSEVRISFTYELKPTYNERLQDATQLADSSPFNQEILWEEDQRFYMYKPWWTGREKRSVIFLGDMISENKIFFYAAWNDYPVHFRDSLHDENDLIYIRPDNSKYYHYKGGEYYLRLRPDFALFDMFTVRKYLFNMYAFSQAESADNGNEENYYETMELGKSYYGFVENKRYQDFRYLQMEMDATYDIRVERIRQRGFPKFFVKTLDEGQGWSGRSDNYQYESVENPEHGERMHNLTLTSQMRFTRWPKCSKLHRTVQKDGKIRCFVAIGVTCDNNEDCAFNLTINMLGVDMSKDLMLKDVKEGQLMEIPPASIMHRDYINNEVSQGQVRYYLFPIDVSQSSDFLVILNKTQIYGTGANGNSKMIMNVQRNIDDARGHFYGNWTYPAESQFQIQSNNAKNDHAEIIQPDPTWLKDQCTQQAAYGCGLLIGVVGQTFEISSYRLRGFFGQNKLEIDTPVSVTTDSETIDGDVYDYFWFTIPRNLESFDYIVSVGTEGKTSEGSNNPDIYVSLADGRYPVKNDYDLKSTMQGADSITISSQDSIWKERGWDSKEGVLVVVSVKRQSKLVPYTLLLKDGKEFKPQIKRIDVGTSFLINQPDIDVAVQDRIYMFYNWEHNDVSMTLSSVEGTTTVMYSRTGQKDYDNNIFTSIPVSKQNAIGYLEVPEGKTEELKIKGDECYECWFFITIRVSNPKLAYYRLTVNKKDNNDALRIKEIQPERQASLYIPSGYFQNRKFILESMDSWSLEAIAANGAVDIFVGLSPKVGANDYIWKASSGNTGMARLEVKTTDQNFHMATYYYVHMRSSSAMDSIISINLKQQRLVHFLTHDSDTTFLLKADFFHHAALFQKFQYRTDQENVKMHIFQVPGKVTNAMQFFRVKLVIESLSDHFYPMIFLNKYESDSQPTEWNVMTYPTLQNYQASFGQNPFDQLNQRNFEYIFEGGSTKAWSYYTMAIYENNWGLTDNRKSEYQIRVIVDKITSTSPNVQSAHTHQADDRHVTFIQP